jgi:hypothetical protein
MGAIDSVAAAGSDLLLQERGLLMGKRSVSLRIPEIGFIAGTRAALGAGLGFLLAGKLNRRRRKKVGWILLTIGAVTTVPLVANVVRKSKESADVVA